MHHANIYTKNSPESTLYCMTSPDHLACHWLNPEHKLIGNESLSRAINFMEQENFREGHIRHIKAALNWSCSKDTSDNIDGSGYTNAMNFRNSIEELDKIRGESFEKVFPELIPILESTYE